MKFTGKLDENGEKVFNIDWPDSQLSFYLVLRDFRYKAVREAVYILMDRYRREFYIGETGASRTAGIFNRFQIHKQEKKFWDRALVIADTHDEFKQDDIRRYYEWKLNAIAKSWALQDSNVKIHSSAGKQDEMYGTEKRLETILAVCRFIGIPWAFNEVPVSNAHTSEECIEDAHAVKSMTFFGHTIWGDANLSWDGAKTFTVVKGSHIRTDGNAPSLGAAGVRARQENAKHYLPEGVLKKDICFSSPSGASDFVCGTPTQGTIFWKDPNGLPIKDFIAKTTKVKHEVKDAAPIQKSKVTWKSMTQLATALANKFNQGKSIDYAIQILGRHVATKHGKWREIMECVGLKFDDAGYVVDWTSAKNLD